MTRPVALVTGAGVRVGGAIARHLARHGYAVAAHYHTHRPRGFAAAFQADLAAPGGPDALAGAFRARFQRLDLLVNSAAGFEARTLEATDAAAFDAQLDLNARAPLLLTRALLGRLRLARGSVVNVADVGGGLVAWSGYAAYAASKAALVRLTECLALELAPRVRVNAVAPGSIEWPEGTDDFPPEERAAIIDHTLLKRMGSPADIAQAVKYLVFDAPYVTGQVINVDGGRTAHL